MRLIDADELKELYQDCEGLTVPCEVVLLNIDDMPTAYDIDKIVEQLEEDSQMALYEMNEPKIYAGIQTAIEVVKEGSLR